MKSLCTFSLVAVVGSTMFGQSVATGDVLFTKADDIAELPNDFFTGTTIHNLGISWIDVNNDDFPDMFVVNGFNESPHLYMNDTDGTFTTRDDLLPNMPNTEQSGSAFADFDNDGDMDLYIFNSNEALDLNEPNDADGPFNQLFQNMWMENGETTVEGQPLFKRIGQSGCENRANPPLGAYRGYRSMTGGWIDYNRDGWVDIFVGNMQLEVAGADGNADFLFRNNGDGSFTDVSIAADIRRDFDGLRPALAWVGAHLNGDRWPDMYVVNVHEPAPHHFDLLYLNDGDGTFTEIIDPPPGMGDDAGSGMGIDVGDPDNDGDWDIYITDIFASENDALPLGNAYYINNGDGTWSDNMAIEAGIQADFSWGCNWVDVDQDGYEDLIVGMASGVGPPMLFQNNQDGTFTDISAAAGFIQPINARGTAWADYDRDGDMDVAIARMNGDGIELYRNDSTDSGHWLEIKLVGATSNMAAINAIVRARAGGPAGLRMLRQIKGGSSTHSQDDVVIHFGLGDNTTANLRVVWPNSGTEAYNNVAADQMITIIEGVGIQ